MTAEVEKTGIFLRRDCSIVMTKGDQAIDIKLGYCQALDLAMNLTELVRDLLFQNMQEREAECNKTQQHLN